jgi:hypothetical protein
MSKGGKSPKRKGDNFEREVVNIARAYGHEAGRTPMSRKPDVRIDNEKVSCKRRRRAFGWMYHELSEHRYILCRDDQKPILKIAVWKP